MTSAILKGHSKSDIKLLLDLAKKMGITAKFLTEEEAEDMALGYAVKEGDSGEYVPLHKYRSKLKK